MYSTTQSKSVSNIITPQLKQVIKQQDIRSPRHSWYFDTLIEDTIDYIAINRQMYRTKTLYAPVTILNSFMLIFI